MDGFDEIVVDADRDLVVEQGAFAGAVIVAGLGVVDIALHRAIQRGGDGVFVGFVLGVVGVERFLPDAAVGEWRNAEKEE